MIFLSEVFWRLKLIKDKDALQKHDETLFDAGTFVSQQNFGCDYLTNISNNSITDRQVEQATFSWKTEIVSESCEDKCGYFKPVIALKTCKHATSETSDMILLIWNWAVRPQLQFTRHWRPE